MASESNPAAGSPRRDLVVIGASAGGVDALKQVVAGLDPGLPAAICVVLHVSPSSPSALARILSRAGTLPCHEARDGDRLRAGEIIVAVPDRHLVVEDGRVRLTLAPRENGHRPAVDTLFRSAAAMRDGRVVGVVLSGNRDDGSAGLAAIKAKGGAAIVQDPADALYSGMPRSAAASVEVDAMVPLNAVAAAITAIVGDAERGVAPAVDDPAPEPRTVIGGAEPDQLNPIVACPECGGVLQEDVQTGVPQWQCRIGHRYSAESLVDAQALSVERALETAIRALDERGALLERMADQFERGSPRSARAFRRRAENGRREADLMRQVLAQANGGTLLGIEGRDDPELEEKTVPGR